MHQRSYTSPLRHRQAEDTHNRILDTALKLMTIQPLENVTHEAVAREGQVALRTVYRHFSSRDELMGAIRTVVEQRLGLNAYPETEDELLANVQRVSRQLDGNPALVRLVSTAAGRQMRSEDNDKRREAVAKALEQATRHLSPSARERVVGVFQLLCSAPAWQILNERAHLDGESAAQALDWALRTLLSALYGEQSKKS
jgi:AcrR family transcriptional regulator